MSGRTRNRIMLSILAVLIFAVGAANMEEMPIFSAMQLFVSGFLACFIGLNHFVYTLLDTVDEMTESNANMAEQFLELARYVQKIAPDKIKIEVGGKDVRPNDPIE